MVLCGPARKTPLAHFAESLEQADVDDEGSASFFPMYVLPVDAFLHMTEVKTHEELRSDGSIVEFDAAIGQAAFVSHQWVARHHPDPNFLQLPVLQSVLRAWMTNPAYISPDLVTSATLPIVRGFSSKELFSKPLHLWYDFFCCPQMSDSGQAKAIHSIPTYIERSRFFFVLFPVVHNATEGKVFSPATWAERGWCRMERTIRALSPNPSYIEVKSEFCVEVVGCHLTSFGGGPPGEGLFTVAADRAKLAPVLRRTFKRSLMLCLRSLDLMRYRTLLNSQNFFLRSFPAEPVTEIVPGFEPLPGADAASNLVAAFLYQNGFRKVRSVDASGCSPLCYAAMNGDPELIDALLAHHADPNDFVRRVSCKGNFPTWTFVVGVCASLGNNDAMCRLLEARANVGGAFPAVSMAAFGDNAKGVHILCQRDRPTIRNFFGLSPMQHGCSSGSAAVVRQLLLHATPDMLSGALWCAAAKTGGSVEIVKLLLDARADINERATLPSRRLRFVIFAQSVQYQLGRRTPATTFAYHLNGSTPLMVAVIAGQHEVAAALIAAGARLDLQNARQKTVTDLAARLRLPDFLHAALEGRDEECREVAALASNNIDLEL